MFTAYEFHSGIHEELPILTLGTYALIQELVSWSFAKHTIGTALPSLATQD